jgi:serine/threonine protein kinase
MTGAAGQLPSQDADDIDDPRVAAAMQEYLEAQERGAAPSRQEFLARHTEIAEALAGCLDGLNLVQELAREVGPAALADSELAPDDFKRPLGDFRIVREIGRGGMGVVYEAVQLSLGRRVALKVLPLAAALDPKYLQRFKNEAQAAARLHHSNIVPVYAVGVDRGVHYYAMQLIEGYSLAELIDHRRQIAGKKPNSASRLRREAPTECGTRPGPPVPPAPSDPTTEFVAPPPVALPQIETAARKSTVPTSSQRQAKADFRKAVELIQQAARALFHAHQAGIIHRDVKPANLLVDQLGNVWVTDFGLALFHADLQLTRTGDLPGTMRYMSPEQALGDRVVLDHRTDIYSLGITLYELLTLEPAVTGNDPHTVLRRIVDEEPERPRLLNKQIPLELETIVLKAIAKAPEERYATAEQFADDLQAWIDDKPIRARRPTIIEHAARWSRRHRSLVAAAAVFLVLATIGLAVTTIVVTREHLSTKAAYAREINARTAADESFRQADESFRQAREAVDTFVALSEDELANKPSLHPLRRMFLETALDYYNTFLEQRRDDPTVREELLAASQRARQIVDDLAILERLAAFTLLSYPEVQEELGISAREGREIMTLLRDTLEEDNQELTQRLTQPSQSGSDRLKALEEQIAQKIDAQQFKRLQQLARQQRGPFAFKMHDVIAALGLTSVQRKQIDQIIEDFRPDRRDPRGPAAPRPPGPPGKAGEPFDLAFGPPPPPEHGPGGHYDEHGKKGPPPHEREPGFGGFGPGGRPKGPGFGGPELGGDPFWDHGPRGKGPPGKEFGKGPRGKGGFEGPPPPSMPGMRETMNRTVEKILKVLNPQQQAAWKELTGAPFLHDLPWRPE